MKRWCAFGAVSAVSVVVFSSVGARADGATTDYVVKAGDTCDGIALRVYGDPKRYDIIHQANPELGPLPHVLKAGTIVHLPADARIAFVRNRVDAFTPGQHPGRADEPLQRGHRVSTYDGSGAEIIFASDATLQLGEDTLVVILGSSRGSLTKTAADTTLVNGSLRAHLAALAGAPDANVAVSTPSGHRVEVGAGESQVSVDATNSTRLAVYRGTGKLTAKKQTIGVPAGFGSKAEKNSVPAPPRPLPPAPAWTTLPPAVLLTSQPASFSAGFAPGSGPGPAPERWHLQLARDDDFNDLVVDARVRRDVTRLEAQGLVAGSYRARVSAIDADDFEGPASAVAMIRVTPLVVQGSPAGGQSGAIAVPTGLFCALDGGPLAPSTGSVPLQRGPAHLLLCAATPEGGGASQTPIPATSIGPLRVDAVLTDAGVDHGTAQLRVLDGAGAPVSSGSRLVVRSALPDQTLGAVVPTPQAGTFTAPVTWRPGASTLALHLTANGVDQADAPPVPLPAAPSSSLPPSARRDHLELAVLAAGSVDAPPDSSSTIVGGGVGVSASLGYAFDSWSASMGARAVWEYDHWGWGSSATPQHSNLLSFGVPLVAHLGSPARAWRSYFTIEPLLLVDIAASGAAFPGGGAAGYLGLSQRVSPVTDVFFEVGGRVTNGFDASPSRGARPAALLHLGTNFSL